MKKVYAVFNEGYFEEDCDYDAIFDDYNVLLGIFEDVNDAIDYVDNYDLRNCDITRIEYGIGGLEEDWRDRLEENSTGTIDGQPYYYGRFARYWEEPYDEVYLGIYIREYELQ